MAEDAGFLGAPANAADAQRLYDEDVAELGYVTNASRLWAHQPAADDALFALMGQMADAAALTQRQRGVLVAACAATIEDAYCSLAWGVKLAAESDADLAAAVLRGDDHLLAPDERALAGWARRVARNPNGTAAADVAPLRAAGYDDGQVLALTVFVALRMAFSTVNDALGARPDRELGRAAPEQVRAAVRWGRPVGAGAGGPE